MQYLEQISEKLCMSSLHTYIYFNPGSLLKRAYIYIYNTNVYKFTKNWHVD